jgi:hypothetical protein
MGDFFVVPDGLEELKEEMPRVIGLIARTARWVHPDTFRALPVWYPEIARGELSYDRMWSTVYKNKNRSNGRVTEKSEANIRAGKAFVMALGARKRSNWTVCHIWGVDDPKFQRSNQVVRDPRFYSCVGNMIWLPTPLKGFTDAVPEVKHMLRICAFHLYGWVCEHTEVASEAKNVATGRVPRGYPEEWPAPGRSILPPGTACFSPRVKAAIENRKAELRRMLNDHSLKNFPRSQVIYVLKSWNVTL